MKEAVELARLVVNKTIVPERKGRGRKGYGCLAALRLLVYALLVGIDKDEPLEKHLRRNRGVAKVLGFERSIPDRTTIGRWKKKLDKIAREAFEKQAGIVEMLAPAKLLLVDSTPLEDWRDSEAEWGYYSRGPFKGFKVHVSVDQLGLPRKAVVAPGNRHDSPFLPELIARQRARHVLGDAGYDSKGNRRACKGIGAKPCFSRNPRRSGRRRYIPRLLKRKHYIVEQFNSLLKEILRNSWLWFKGLVKKASVVYSGLLATSAVALRALLLSDMKSLRKISAYRY